AVVKLAKKIGHSPSQVALAWLLAQEGAVIPIIGARKLSQFQDNLGCLEVKLTDAHLKQLDEASNIDPGFPHNFLSDPAIIERLYGGLFYLICYPRGLPCNSGLTWQ